MSYQITIFVVIHSTIIEREREFFSGNTLLRPKKQIVGESSQKTGVNVDEFLQTYQSYYKVYACAKLYEY